MLVVRGTKKLRDRVKGGLAGADDRSTTVLGDWFATALFWKPQVALLVNEATMVPVLLPLAPAATLLDRIPVAIAEVPRAHGTNPAFITAVDLLELSLTSRGFRAGRSTNGTSPLTGSSPRSSQRGEEGPSPRCDWCRHPRIRSTRVTCRRRASTG